MKNKISFWIAIGISIGTATGIVSKNAPAGVCIGIGAGMLLMILTNLEADRKIRN
jgi:hypothetical protein